MSRTSTGSTQCPVCAGASFAAVYTSAPDPITGNDFSIQRCAECGVAFTAPRPTDLEPYYPEQYRGYGPLVTGILKFFYRLRVLRWSRNTSSGMTMLEIGCGAGVMLSVFREEGWSVLGLERNAAMAEQARRQFGLEVLACDVADLPETRKFDLIIMFNVLEHLANPVEVLAACARRLTPAGRIIVSVPNFDGWQARFGGPAWLHLDPPRHLVHFSVETISGALRRAGLGLEDVSFMSFEHDPYGWTESAINRITRRSNILTRYLMGFDRFGPFTLLACSLFSVLAVPAVLLAAVSWAAGRGALMQVTARKPRGS